LTQYSNIDIDIDISFNHVIIFFQKITDNAHSSCIDPQFEVHQSTLFSS